MEYSKGVIKKVAGPLVIAEGMRDANMFDVVRVSDKHLIGEIIEMQKIEHQFRFMRRQPDLDRESLLYQRERLCQ